MANIQGRNRYIHGSAALDIQETSPVRVPRRREVLTEDERRRRQAERYAEENRRKAGRFGTFYTAVISLAVGITMFICANYISLFNQKNSNSKQINQLQKELNSLKEVNDLKQLEIDTSINYDYIYKVATEELGMVHAGSGQIVEYKSGECEYVIQYSDITKNNN